MTPITIDAQVNEDHQLILSLPPEVPVGRVKVTIEAVEAAPEPLKRPQTREEVRQILLDAGLLTTVEIAPEEIEGVDDHEEFVPVELEGVESAAKPLKRAQTREEVQQILLDAGLLSTTKVAPPDAAPMTDEDRERISKLFDQGTYTTLDAINEDRGPK